MGKLNLIGYVNYEIGGFPTQMIEDISPFLGFILATVVGLGISITTLFVVNKSGLASYQSTLVQTLQDNAAALKARVDILEVDIKNLHEVRNSLEIEIDRLRNAVSDLAIENAELRRQLGLNYKEDF